MLIFSTCVLIDIYYTVILFDSHRYWGVFNAFNGTGVNFLMYLAVFIFIFAWILQFFGHIIEGNRPALMTSIKQSFLEAPLFTVEYIYPSLLELP